MHVGCVILSYSVPHSFSLPRFARNHAVFEKLKNEPHSHTSVPPPMNVPLKCSRMALTGRLGASSNVHVRLRQTLVVMLILFSPLRKRAQPNTPRHAHLTFVGVFQGLLDGEVCGLQLRSWHKEHVALWMTSAPIPSKKLSGLGAQSHNITSRKNPCFCTSNHGVVNTSCSAVECSFANKPHPSPIEKCPKSKSGNTNQPLSPAREKIAQCPPVLSPARSKKKRNSFLGLCHNLNYRNRREPTTCGTMILTTNKFRVAQKSTHAL